MTDRAGEIGRRFACVLETMVEIMGSDPSAKFGDALERAAWKHGYSSLPQDVEQALLTAAFKIMATGRIPGAPDA